MAMGVEVQKIPEGLDGDDCHGKSLVPWAEANKKHIQGIPGKATQFEEKSTVIGEVMPEDLRHAEGEVPVRDGLEDLLTKPLPEFHHPFLVAGRTEVPSFAGEGQEILVATVFAFYTGETIVEDAAIKITVDHLLHISTEKSVFDGEAFVIDLFKFLKVILNALVILGILRFARAVC